jgi:hypothetical protein
MVGWDIYSVLVVFGNCTQSNGSSSYVWLAAVLPRFGIESQDFTDKVRKELEFLDHGALESWNTNAM